MSPWIWHECDFLANFIVKMCTYFNCFFLLFPSPYYDKIVESMNMVSWSAHTKKLHPASMMVPCDVVDGGNASLEKVRYFYNSF